MSQFGITADTDDYSYGKGASQKLADTNPGNAINNAGNQEYMAENSLKQACETGTPVPPESQVPYVGQSPSQLNLHSALTVSSSVVIACVIRFRVIICTFLISIFPHIHKGVYRYVRAIYFLCYLDASYVESIHR